jgi:hypothetical protein
LEEQAIPPGVDFKGHIKVQLGDAETVIAVVSPQYYISAFCMGELGATWALAKNLVPLLIPPVDSNDLRGSLFGTQALAVGQSEKLDSMHAVLVELANPPEKVSRWNSRKKQFLEKLPALLQALTPIKTMSEKEAQLLRAELDEYKREFEEADAELSILEAQIVELSKLKDSGAVDESRKKYSKDSDRFDELLSNSQEATRQLPAVVRAALFHKIRGEIFFPDYNQWHDEPQQAAEDNLMEADENGFSVREDHPRVQRALKALTALSDFLNDLPADFPVKEYQNKYEDLLELTSRPFWVRHRLL